VAEWHETPFNTDRAFLQRGERYRLYPGVLFGGLSFPFDQTTWYRRAPDALGSRSPFDPRSRTWRLTYSSPGSRLEAPRTLVRLA
jgi:hypothetical protein